MKLIFERLGALDRGEIELADLTIICGENNSGKTYVTYALYCLLKSWISLTRISLDTEMNELREAGVAKINIRTKIVEDWPRIREKLLEKFLQAFPAMMASCEKSFSQTRLNFEVEIGESWKKKKFNMELNSGKTFATFHLRNHARPVEDNIRFAAALPGPDNELSPLIKNHPGLLGDFGKITGGQYVTNKDGITCFQPAGTKKLKLGLDETSSAVRSLLITWYWLKHHAKAGDMLMIDEPELNLHPANQRRLARFIAALIDAGVKVFITTHSDTIIREFNTLIMLARDLPHFASVRAQNNYAEHERLPPERVRLYYTGKALFDVEDAKKRRRLTTLLPARIDPGLGIDVKTFDQTIIDMNRMQDDLRYGGE